VVARNRAGEESRLVDSEDDIVKTVSRSEVTTTVNWAILGTLDNIASIRDTVSIVVTYANPTRPIRKVLWYDGEYTGELAVPAREKPDSSLSGSDTLKRSWDTHGSKMVTVRIFDDGGIEWSERITVRVLADAPLADAGPDTTVSINDSFFVNYSGTDLYGTVVKYRLDLNGDGTFDDSANENGQLTGQASSQAEDVKVIVQAEDDDGNLDNDTMVVHVVVDPPVANAGNDTIVGRGDTIYLRGSGSADKFGSISKYEWDIGNSGNFIETSSGDTTITIGDSFNFNGFDCVLRVTDDDSISSLDTVSIIIGILNQVNSHAEFSARAEHSTIAFNNKLWIIGGNDNPQPWNYTYNNDIWYSDNGINWFLSTDSADFSSRGEHACEIFNNNMLIISGTNDRDNFRDVWSSPDGQTWTLQTSNTVFSGRKRFSSAVFQNKIWVIGGMGKFLGEDYNDVWFSDDGITWQAATDSAGFTPRAGHSTVVFDNKLWVIGGYRGAFEPYNDVWSSVDGITWENETNSASFAPGGDHAATAYAGKIWLVGGHSVPGSSGCSNEIWFSSDGRNWKKLPYSLPRGKSNHTLTVFNNKLFIIGGQLDDGTLTNDIWCLD
ncbi:MAG: hypothetical protein JXA18_14425, partial [Chitinispirillaceae bacterium]|nr:hypothetical protein [Chitinispirillaceae bacterium]